MITIKSNIEFLTQYNAWRKGETGKVFFDAREMTAHIQYAIETMNHMKQLKDDAWNEKRIEVIARNGATADHYE